MTCPACGRITMQGELSCASCDTLTHRDRLQALARTAEAAEDPSDALAAWREAFDLLPPESHQSRQVGQRILELSEQVGGASPVAAPPKSARNPTASKTGIGAAMVGVGLLLFKFKSLIFLALTKLKFLALGLSKLPTLFSMFATFALYTMFWGWPFALGFVLCIYVHEIGHVVALRQFGIAASAPMFIPGFGAFVRMKQYPATERENARVGMGGPIWGTGAAGVAAAFGVALDSQMMLAIASTAAMLNLFNLIPIGSLDGGRAYSGMRRLQRGIVAGVFCVSWAFTSEPFALIVGLIMGGRAAIQKEQPEKGDMHTTVWFCVLAICLSALAAMKPPPPL